MCGTGQKIILKIIKINKIDGIYVIESIFVGFSCIRIHRGMSGIGQRKTDRLIQEKPTNILSMTYIPSILLILIIFKIILCPVLHKE